MKNPKGGVAAVAEMLNAMDPENRERLLGELARREPELAAKIEQAMFGFEHLVRLDDLTIQAILKETPMDLLALALRSASETLVRKIHANLSRRASELLREEIASSPKRRLSDVRAAQDKIVAIARRRLSG